MRRGRARKDELKGQTPIGLVVLKAGVNRPARRSRDELVALVRERIGPVAVVPGRARGAAAAEDAVRQDPARQRSAGIADGETAAVPPTIDDPAALDEVATVLRQRGD